MLPDRTSVEQSFRYPQNPKASRVPKPFGTKKIVRKSFIQNKM
jgi:hypothetical protein